MAKTGLTIRQFQAKIYEIVFNPAYVQLGDPSSAVGALDAFIGVATGLYMTYEILFNQTSLTPEDENLQLGNAWVTAIPVVGDFAQGIITGSEGVWEGDRGKVVEAGLWISIGVMGCVPGGQLPALVTGIMPGDKAPRRQAPTMPARPRTWSRPGWNRAIGPMDQKPRRLKGLVRPGGKAPRDYLRRSPDGRRATTSRTGRERCRRASGDRCDDERLDPRLCRAVCHAPVHGHRSLRDALKNLYPDFNDKDWTDEFTAKIKIEDRGGKGGLPLFGAYYPIRTKALEQTLAQLKSWAEDEMRAEKDYEAEVAAPPGRASEAAGRAQVSAA